MTSQYVDLSRLAALITMGLKTMKRWWKGAEKDDGDLIVFTLNLKKLWSLLISILNLVSDVKLGKATLIVFCRCQGLAKVVFSLHRLCQRDGSVEMRNLPLWLCKSSNSLLSMYEDLLRSVPEEVPGPDKWCQVLPTLPRRGEILQTRMAHKIGPRND